MAAGVCAVEARTLSTRVSDPAAASRVTPSLPARAVTNALSVDLEDWYQGTHVDAGEWWRYEDRVEPATWRLLELFAEADVRATFFVLGYVAERKPHLVMEIEACGHEIATHGYRHTPFYESDARTVRADLQRAVGLLEDLAQRPVLGHRAPFFSITRESWWALELLADLGLRYDSSVFPIRHWRCGVPDAPRLRHVIDTPSGPLIEFPPSTVSFRGLNLPVAGGAYLRALPYELTRRAIRRINAEGAPAVIYLHPWEVDPGLSIGLRRSFPLSQHLNRRATVPRLRALFREFAFAPMGELLP